MNVCTCNPDLSGAPWCSLHRCDCNIWCGHLGSSRPHIFAPGEWCGGNDQTWLERSPDGQCRVHPPNQPHTEAAPNRAALSFPGGTND